MQRSIWLWGLVLMAAVAAEYADDGERGLRTVHIADREGITAVGEPLPPVPAFPPTSTTSLPPRGTTLEPVPFTTAPWVPIRHRRELWQPA